MRILLIEDDPMIADAVEEALREAAYAVDAVGDSRLAGVALETQRYDLILLDLGLPDGDGLNVLAALRERENPVPVLIVTARDSVDERIRGLDTGADDYLPKPFDMDELLARVRALLRRSGGNADPVMRCGGLTLDPATRQAALGGSEPVTLTRREFALLASLMQRPGAILSRTQLEERVYGWGEEVESNAVEFLIHAVRRKLGPAVIRNVRGVGWLVSDGASGNH